jgi:CHAD domain-containing protein
MAERTSFSRGSQAVKDLKRSHMAHLLPQGAATLYPPLRIRPRRTDDIMIPETVAMSVDDSFGVEANDSMAAAARKIFSREYRIMLSNEKGARKGKDVERVHDMRVAVRRMRTASRVFAPFFDPEVLDPHRKELRKIGRRLGPVRDMDVMLSDAHRFAETLPPRKRVDLEGLIVSWHAQSQEERETLKDYLDSARYRKFKRSFRRFLEEPEKDVLPIRASLGSSFPARVRHAAPPIIYERLASVLAFDGWVDGTDVPLDRYHRLRIEAKRLRYTLEFFQDLAGTEVESLIVSLQTLQDHLGSLREAVLVDRLLQAQVRDSPAEGRRQRNAPYPGVRAYIEDRQSEARHLAETFPEVWEPIRAGEFRRRIAAVVATF